MTLSQQPGDDQHDIQRVWGRIPSAPIFAGCLRDMPLGQLKILSALTGHANREFMARVGIKRLAELTGLSQRWVRACVRALETRRLLAVKRGGGKGRANSYQLCPEAAAAILGAAALASASTATTVRDSTRRTPTKTEPKPAKTRTESSNDEVRVDRQRRMYVTAVEMAMEDQRHAITNRWRDFPDFLRDVGDEAAAHVFDEEKSDRHSTGKSPAAVAAELAALAREGSADEATAV